ncbi:hypothetical protein [uncultured Deefgea sp.]|uniref:hypothetical protein n=1 Tax=uncultured Deefgea sp. TaxID=1304914 RepID=UPI002605E2B7|nr:hypothetical protein [uncultured Deefgea sp.]
MEETNIIEKAMIANGIRDIANNLGYFNARPVESIYLCKSCGMPAVRNTSTGRPCAKDLCFHCNHWNITVEGLLGPITEKDSPYRVLAPISDGYELVSFQAKIFRNDSDEYLGHGGRLFRFKMPWGTVVESNNVWSGGYVPNRFHEQLKHRMVEAIANNFSVPLVGTK